jgi:hypothetical protein
MGNKWKQNVFISIKSDEKINIPSSHKKLKKKHYEAKLIARFWVSIHG